MITIRRLFTSVKTFRRSTIPYEFSSSAMLRHFSSTAETSTNPADPKTKPKLKFSEQKQGETEDTKLDVEPFHQFNHDINLALGYMDECEFQKAANILNKLLSSGKNLRGTKEYYNLLRFRSTCYYHLRRYQDADLDAQNAVEYAKYGKENNMINEQRLYRIKLNTLSLFVYTNIERGIDLAQEIADQDYAKMAEPLKEEFNSIRGTLYLLRSSPESREEGRKMLINGANNSRNTAIIGKCLHNVAMSIYFEEHEDSHVERKLVSELTIIFDEKAAKDREKKYHRMLMKIKQKSLTEKDVSSTLLKTLMLSTDLIRGQEHVDKLLAWDIEKLYKMPEIDLPMSVVVNFCNIAEILLQMGPKNCTEVI
jgi:hypothetical protein